MMQLFAENKHIIIYKKDIPVDGNSLGLPESGLRWKSELVWQAIFRATFL
jgi:hypothetical protein